MEVMTDVLQHLVVELILVTTGSLFAAHGQDTALAMLHVPLLFPLFHLLEVSLQLAMYYNYIGPFHIYL